MFLVFVFVRATEGYTFVARRIFKKSYLILIGCVFITFFVGENPHIKCSPEVTHG